ncbi:MAG: hypothetical protein EG828_11435 [Deltaproteobacteria bacterium]|nr:hypothetical protein [Deltaproteobacteria bacterium]
MELAGLLGADAGGGKEEQEDNGHRLAVPNVISQGGDEKDGGDNEKNDACARDNPHSFQTEKLLPPPRGAQYIEKRLSGINHVKLQGGGIALAVGRL